MSGAVRRRDNGYAALKKRVQEFKAPQVAVGILAKDGAREESDGVTVLDVGTWAEFGTATEPERSFIRATFEEDRLEIRTRMQRATAAVLAGRLTRAQALEQLGQWMQGRVQERIARGIDPPNAPSTIAAKRSSTPLIAKGQLRGAVSYEVREGGEGES